MKKLFIVLFFITQIGCSTQEFIKDSIVYEPVKDQEISYFFTNGVPIGSYKTKNSFILFSVDKTELIGETFLRIWFLYKNTTNKPFLLEPYNILSVNEINNGKDTAEYYPMSPTYILAEIKQQEAEMMIMKAI